MMAVKSGGSVGATDASGQFPTAPPAQLAPPPDSLAPGGYGPLAGQLVDAAHAPKIEMYKSTVGGYDPGDHVNAVELFDDYNDPLTIIMDGYDFTQLATFARSAGDGAALIWKAVVARNYALNGWLPFSDAYAAVVPDQDHSRLVLPTDPSVGAPPGTRFGTIGNVPLTIPANASTGSPALPMNVTIDRFTRIGYFSSNQGVRSVWNTTYDAWAMFWDVLKSAVQFAVDIIEFNFADALNRLDYRNLPTFQNVQQMNAWMQQALQNAVGGLKSGGSGAGGASSSVPRWLWYVGGGALALALLGFVFSTAKES